MSFKTIGLLVGATLFLALAILPPFQTFHDAAQRFLAEQSPRGIPVGAETLARSMQTIAALMALMVIWWVTEAIRLSYTALLPLIVLPLLQLVGLHKDETVEFSFISVANNYFSPVVLLFFGGFLLAGALRRWRLDRRLTLWILTRGQLAESARATLLGMMAITAFLSMWISNTATCAMMLPLSLGILSYIGATPGESSYGKALMLGIAWAASIGGMGTLIGTPPNGIAIGILNSALANDPTYHRITFLDWMKFGVPYVVLFVPVAWFVLLKTFPPEFSSFEGGKQRLLGEFRSLGEMSRGELGTITVFVLAVVLWIVLPFREQLLPNALLPHIRWLDEYTTGLLAGTLLFLIPVDWKTKTFLLHWKDFRYVEWGALAIVGGGIALSDAMFKTGFASWLASSFIGMFGAPSTLVMMFALVFFIDFLTEIATNSAVVAMMAPTVISIAKATGADPVSLTIAAALASSMAFMLPVATPPNAIVYGTRYIAVNDMIKGGFILDILGWLFTIGILVIFGSWIFGVLTL
jgi:sodium-dependent dicarboxylate transporter 2/3/5